MTDQPLDPAAIMADMAAVEEMGGCVLPTEIGLRSALQWLAKQEGYRTDWYAEEAPTLLAGIDAARRVLAEARRLAAALAAAQEREVEYANAITWGTSCLSCSRVLDGSIRETERAERAETGIAAVTALHVETSLGFCDHCWDAPNDQPVPYPCATLRAALAGED